MGTVMKRQIIVLGDFAYIPLSNGMFATIDAVDVPLVDGYDWTAAVRRNTIYVKRATLSKGVRKTILLHRVIAGTPDGMDTDHVNGNGLDNRRVNLRPATKIQNATNSRLCERNTSGLKGAMFYRANGKWRSQIVVNRRNIHLGYYATPEEAHAVYAKASAEMHGEFGRTV
jgi:hypothetical protein